MIARAILDNEPQRPSLDSNLTLMHQHHLSTIEEVGVARRNPNRLSLDSAAISKSVSALSNQLQVELRPVKKQAAHNYVSSPYIQRGSSSYLQVLPKQGSYHNSSTRALSNDSKGDSIKLPKVAVGT